VWSCGGTHYPAKGGTQRVLERKKELGERRRCGSRRQKIELVRLLLLRFRPTAPALTLRRQLTSLLAGAEREAQVALGEAYSLLRAAGRSMDPPPGGKHVGGNGGMMDPSPPASIHLMTCGGWAAGAGLPSAAFGVGPPAASGEHGEGGIGHQGGDGRPVEAGFTEAGPMQVRSLLSIWAHVPGPKERQEHSCMPTNACLHHPAALCRMRPSPHNSGSPECHATTCEFVLVPRPQAPVDGCMAVGPSRMAGFAEGSGSGASEAHTHFPHYGAGPAGVHPSSINSQVPGHFPMGQPGDGGHGFMHQLHTMEFGSMGGSMGVAGPSGVPQPPQPPLLPQLQQLPPGASSWGGQQPLAPPMMPPALPPAVPPAWGALAADAAGGSGTGRIQMSCPTLPRASVARNTVRQGNKHRRLFDGQAGALKDGDLVSYVMHGEKLLTGTVVIKEKSHGILCDHCRSVISCSAFEAHAGQGKRLRMALLYIYVVLAFLHAVVCGCWSGWVGSEAWLRVLQLHFFPSPPPPFEPSFIIPIRPLLAARNRQVMASAATPTTASPPPRASRCGRWRPSCPLCRTHTWAPLCTPASAPGAASGSWRRWHRWRTACGMCWASWTLWAAAASSVTRCGARVGG
jgi:hypothetical protein